MKSLIKYSISALILARNEEDTIEKVIQESIKILPTLSTNYEILINDDASNDKTPEILDKLVKKYSFIRVFHQKSALGIRDGLEFLYKQAKGNLIFTNSGDGQYTIDDLPKMLKKIESGYDLVIGKRTSKQYSWKRNFISFCFNSIPKILFGVNLYDAGSIKLYKKEVLKNTTPSSKSVFNEAERIIIAHRLGYKITSVPAQHFLRKRGTTGIKLDIIFNSVLDMLRLRFYS